MSFVILCHDHPGQVELRLTTRQAHLEYLDGFADRLRLAGPLLDEDGQMAGSLLIMDFASQQEAEDFCADDPYARAGLFERVEIRRFRPVLPK